jgi:hypothetical protein
MKTKSRSILLILSTLLSSLAGLCPVPAQANTAGPYIHNALGGLRIGYTAYGITAIVYDDPTIVKNILDGGWSQAHDQINRLLEGIRTHTGDNVEVDSELANVDKTELRMLQLPEGVALKYVLHENRVWVKVKMPWPAPAIEFVMQFNIEMVLTLQASHDGQPLRVTSAVAFVRNSKIDRYGLPGELAKPFIDTLMKNIQELEAQINYLLIPLLDTVNENLAPLSKLLKQIPPDLVHVNVEVEPHSGKLSLCFRHNPDEHCTFTTSPERIVQRSVLGTAIDRCSQPVVWIWDVEKEHHIGIRKGDSNVEVQVNREFEWFCGWEDDLGMRERVVGPTETTGVRVARAASGQRIDWQFLYWR